MTIATHILEDLLLIWCIVGVACAYLAIQACRASSMASRLEEEREAELDQWVATVRSDLNHSNLAQKPEQKGTGTRQS